MDAWLERLLGRLDEAGVLDDTLVILTSDHGENFGEGHLIGHGFSLDERLINIPFVVAGPGSDAIRGIRSLGELAPRIATATGLDDHPYRPEDDLPPLPVAQLNSPAPPRGDPRTEGVIDLWQLDDESAGRLTMSLTAAVDGGVKLVVRDEREAFFDLREDPLELRPLTADAVDTEVRERLRRALAHPSVTASRALLQPADAEAAAGANADLEERMRLLGYL
jgi:arylsulfatase A-like enzyme